MEHKYMYNPDIIKFLSQYDKSEWDAIIEDLIMFSINKIKEIEKEEQPQKQIEYPRKVNIGGGIISFNSPNCGPYECAKNILKNNQELKSNSGQKNNTLKMLDELNNKINVIQSGKKLKKNKKNK
jgi:uncharacterized protein (UPF0179 family)